MQDVEDRTDDGPAMLSMLLEIMLSCAAHAKYRHLQHHYVDVYQYGMLCLEGVLHDNDHHMLCLEDHHMYYLLSAIGVLCCEHPTNHNYMIMNTLGQLQRQCYAKLLSHVHLICGVYCPMQFSMQILDFHKDVLEGSKTFAWLYHSYRSLDVSMCDFNVPAVIYSGSCDEPPTAWAIDLVSGEESTAIVVLCGFILQSIIHMQTHVAWKLGDEYKAVRKMCCKLLHIQGKLSDYIRKIMDDVLTRHKFVCNLALLIDIDALHFSDKLHCARHMVHTLNDNTFWGRFHFYINALCNMNLFDLRYSAMIVRERLAMRWVKDDTFIPWMKTTLQQLWVVAELEDTLSREESCQQLMMAFSDGGFGW